MYASEILLSFIENEELKDNIPVIDLKDTHFLDTSLNDTWIKILNKRKCHLYIKDFRCTNIVEQILHDSETFFNVIYFRNVNESINKFVDIITFKDYLYIISHENPDPIIKIGYHDSFDASEGNAIRCFPIYFSELNMNRYNIDSKISDSDLEIFKNSTEIKNFMDICMIEEKFSSQNIKSDVTIQNVYEYGERVLNFLNKIYPEERLDDIITCAWFFCQGTLRPDNVRLMINSIGEDVLKKSYEVNDISILKNLPGYNSQTTCKRICSVDLYEIFSKHIHSKFLFKIRERMNIMNLEEKEPPYKLSPLVGYRSNNFVNFRSIIANMIGNFHYNRIPKSDDQLYYRNLCVHENSKVLMGNNMEYYARDIAVGDYVKTPQGISRIKLIIETILTEVTEISQIGSLFITPDHPIKVEGRWIMPKNHPKNKIFYSNNCRVYSFALESNHIMIINGIEVICLGHDIVDPIVKHPYLGTRRIIDDLLPISDSDGIVRFHSGDFMMHKITGQVSINPRFYQRKLIEQEISLDILLNEYS